MSRSAPSVSLDVGPVGDARLLAGLRAGDEALFAAFVADLTPVLARLARSHTSTQAAAQDAVQDTWLTVVDKLDSFEGRSSLTTWVCGILVHTARRHGVRDARTLPFSSVWRDEHAPAVDPGRFHSRRDAATTGTWAIPPLRWDLVPEDQLAAKELHRVIDDAITALPQRQREVITARDVVGMDAAEASVVLGVSSGNQRVLLHRARSKVRAALEDYAALEDRAGLDDRAAHEEHQAASAAAVRLHRHRRQVVCQRLVELATDYLEGDLDPGQRAAVEEHLAHCGHCTGYLAQVRRMLELTAARPHDQATIRADLLATITTRYRDRP